MLSATALAGLGSLGSPVEEPEERFLSQVRCLVRVSRHPVAIPKEGRVHS